MLRILAVSDIHYPDPDYASTLWFLQSILNKNIVDVLILGGDFLSKVTDTTIHKLFRILRKGYRGDILVVYGNHEHYLTINKLKRGIDSLSFIWELRDKLARYNVHVLDIDGPKHYDDIVVIGNVGWYDYSFAIEQYTINDYENCNPYGVSLNDLEKCVLGKYSTLHNVLCPPTWRNDCIFVKLPFTNKEYVRLNIEKLRKQIEEVISRVVLVLHHVPRRELIRYYGDPLKDFDIAYAGSIYLGEFIREFHERIITVLYGHLHSRSIGRIAILEDNIPYINMYHRVDNVIELVLLEINNGEIHISALSPRTRNH